jgi:hypothetical protein
MISPESGIHRPSYNGAPAKQTLNERYLTEFLVFETGCALQRVRRVARIARRRGHKAN